MAITVTVGLGSEPAVALVPGSRRRARAKITFDTSYPTGGYTVTAAQVALTTLDSVEVSGVDQTGTYLVVWNQATAKLQLFSSLGTEVSNATDVHAGSVLVTAVGL